VPNPAAKPKDEDRYGLKPEVILRLLLLQRCIKSKLQIREGQN